VDNCFVGRFLRVSAGTIVFICAAFSAAFPLPDRKIALECLDRTMTTDVWLHCCESLAASMPPQQYTTWIKPLNTVSLSAEQEGGVRVATLTVPNRFKLDWIRTQYTTQIERALSEVLGSPVSLNVVIAKTAPTSPTASKLYATHDSRSTFSGGVAENVAASGAPFNGGATSSLAHQTSLGNGRDGARSISRINPSYSFDSLVPGKANQLARAAALQVASNPGSSYNPLFIYGGVGLGKTHLIQSVGNAILENMPRARIRYTNADGFVSEFVKAVQRKTIDEFKQYYHNLDLLLIDDVQFFSGKEKSQEEFFYAFEALFANRSQIILTSDTYPKEISGIDQRLLSRFDAGLTIAIEPPELELRVAILMKKAPLEDIVLSEEVAFFIAQNVRSNVRDLEGALRKVAAYAKFHRERNVNQIVLAKEALKDLLNSRNRLISVENIQKTVADFYNIKTADMYSKKRPAAIARPRQIAMYIAKELTQKSLPEIGENFGGRDHTTVLHAVRKIGELRLRDAELNRQLHVLEQTLKA
jgi:chromosomal replication initiator protein